MKIKNILLQILIIIWQLPQTLIGLFMIPFLGKLKLIKYEKYCWVFEAEKMEGGISLGCFIFLSKTLAKNKTTLMHELGHTVDSHIFGPLYLFIIGIPSLCWAAFCSYDKCYYDFYTEKRANEHAGLGVDTLCRLYIKDR